MCQNHIAPRAIQSYEPWSPSPHERLSSISRTSPPVVMNFVDFSRYFGYPCSFFPFEVRKSASALSPPLNVYPAYIISFEQTGQPLSLNFASMFSRDATTLALSDAVLVGSTLLCVPFAKALQRGWIRYNTTGIILQHIFQTTLLAVAVTWTFNRQWPWVQSGFLTLHTLVMIMKVHSYVAHNGNLSIISKDAVYKEHQLRKATNRVGGWDQALRDATRHRISSHLEGSTTESTPAGTPFQIPEDASRSYYDGPTPVALRNRLLAATDSLPNGKHNYGRTTSPPPVEPSNLPPHPLTYHPDPEISELAKDMTELESELTSTGPERVRWPANITWANYADYLLVPSLVYELEFPRTDRYVMQAQM